MNTKENNPLDGYTLDRDDMVTDPGKFEGLHASYVLAYNAYLGGESDGEYIEHNGTGNDVLVSHTTIEWNGWPRVVSFWEDDNGFVMPFDTGKFLTFDPPASIAVGTLETIKSYDGVARNFTLGTVIEHLCSGANPTTKFQLGFGDLAADIGTVTTAWDWSNGHLFWVLARDSATTLTDDPGLALEYAKTGGFPFVREYRIEFAQSAHTGKWWLTYGDVMTESYFEDIKHWYNELMLFLVKEAQDD